MYCTYTSYVRQLTIARRESFDRYLSFKFFGFFFFFIVVVVDAKDNAVIVSGAGDLWIFTTARDDLHAGSAREGGAFRIVRQNLLSSMLSLTVLETEIEPSMERLLMSMSSSFSLTHGPCGADLARFGEGNFCGQVSCSRRKMKKKKRNCELCIGFVMNEYFESSRFFGDFFTFVSDWNRSENFENLLKKLQRPAWRAKLKMIKSWEECMMNNNKISFFFTLVINFVDIKMSMQSDLDIFLIIRNTRTYIHLLYSLSSSHRPKIEIGSITPWWQNYDVESTISIAFCHFIRSFLCHLSMVAGRICQTCVSASAPFMKWFGSWIGVCWRSKNMTIKKKYSNMKWKKYSSNSRMNKHGVFGGCLRSAQHSTAFR